jgi:hypothetical protein
MVGTPDFRQEFNNPLRKQRVTVTVGLPPLPGPPSLDLPAAWLLRGSAQVHGQP